MLAVIRQGAQPDVHRCPLIVHHSLFIFAWLRFQRVLNIGAKTLVAFKQLRGCEYGLLMPHKRLPFPTLHEHPNAVSDAITCLAEGRQVAIARVDQNYKAVALDAEKAPESLERDEAKSALQQSFEPFHLAGSQVQGASQSAVVSGEPPSRSRLTK